MGNIITLTNESQSIQYLCQKDKRLAKVIKMVGNISYSIHPDGYEFLVHEIIEQMMSIKAGKKIFDRLVLLCDGKVCPENVNILSDEQIRSTGTSNAKVAYIRNITDAFISEEISDELLQHLSDDDIKKILTSVKGIGNWTAKMYLIFVLDRPNILPYEDGAFLQSYRWMYKTDDCSPSAIKKKCKKWSPYSSIASRYLYRALDLGFVKSEFHLFK